MAASQVMRQEGFNDCAKVITALQAEPEIGSKLKEAISLDLEAYKPTKANHIRTLSQILCKGESVQGYTTWRNNINKTVGYNLYPSYQTLAKSKVHLHPSVSLNSHHSTIAQFFNFQIIIFQVLLVNPGGSFVYRFQDVFEHTARRILQLPRIKRRLEVVMDNCSGRTIVIIFYVKYGFDVSISIEKLFLHN